MTSETPNPSPIDLHPPKPPDRRRTFLSALLRDGSVGGGEPLSPRVAKKVFSESEDYFGKPCTYRGSRAINFSMEETEKLAAHLKFALIGKFSHGYPSMNTIRSYFSKLGLRGAYSIGVINIKHVIIKLHNEDDMSRLWLKQILFIDGFPMRIFKWSPEFNPKIESSVVPVWIRFPELPFHLFQKKALFGIASLIGSPLKIDEATADGIRPSVARVCVEIDLMNPHPTSIWVGTEGRYYAQTVTYERLPKYCSHCRHLGHGMEQCREGREKDADQVHPTEEEIPDLRALLNRRKKKNVAVPNGEQGCHPPSPYGLTTDTST
ncbi:UNVERIFIED_CONTAM: hypothetical protein Sradi_3664600 [Sesamum radiatum]|uniref:DUF4283 domain-containing protein n=1 Tax=Sesamum radiatum TaxID=300843 RepID=A0AAW2QIQ7_SESRA